jgi:hypothetical protein
MSKSTCGFAVLSLLASFWFLFAMDKNVHVKFKDKNFVSPDDDLVLIGYIVQMLQKSDIENHASFDHGQLRPVTTSRSKRKANGTWQRSISLGKNLASGSSCRY